MKKVDDMFSESAAGDGWFKIWEDGYNQETDTWCVDTLIENNGLLTVDLPTGIPPGYYILRPELLALHSATDGDPQFYTGCAQVFIQDGPDVALDVPSEYSVSIPGYIEAGDPGITFNIYTNPIEEYPIPGPEVYRPTSSASTMATREQDAGVIPSDCLLKNANWCGFAVSASNDVTSCWDSAEECWNQADVCWDELPPSGGQNCEIWGEYCTSIGDQCEAGNYDGPPALDREEYVHPAPGDIPSMYGDFPGTEVDAGDSPDTTPSPSPSSIAAPEPTSTVAPSPIITPVPSETATVPDESEPSPEPEPEPEPQPEQPPTDDNGLTISLDGRCGGETGQTCIGSAFGDCCSRKGKCGRKTRHCTCGCQPEFGTCTLFD
jgi:hypothetical protein